MLVMKEIKFYKTSSGKTRLKPIFELLDAEVPYDDIRIAHIMGKELKI